MADFMDFVCTNWFSNLIDTVMLLAVLAPCLWFIGREIDMWQEMEGEDEE